MKPTREELQIQIDKLANFIMAEVEGEPSADEGAVDCAIRVIKTLQSASLLSYEQGLQQLQDECNHGRLTHVFDSCIECGKDIPRPLAGYPQSP